MAENSMSLVATFVLPHEAKLAQGLLESAGIPTLLRNEHAHGKGSAGAYLELYAPTDREQQAKELLDSQVSQKTLEAQAKTAGPQDFEWS